MVAEKEINNKHLKALGDVFRVWRLKHGYSQNEIAKRSGISVSNIRRLEKGENATTNTFLAYFRVMWNNNDAICNADKVPDILQTYLAYIGMVNKMDYEERNNVLADRKQYIKD